MIWEGSEKSAWVDCLADDLTVLFTKGVWSPCKGVIAVAGSGSANSCETLAVISELISDFSLIIELAWACWLMITTLSALGWSLRIDEMRPAGVTVPVRSKSAGVGDVTSFLMVSALYFLLSRFSCPSPESIVAVIFLTNAPPYPSPSFFLLIDDDYRLFLSTSFCSKFEFNAAAAWIAIYVGTVA